MVNRANDASDEFLKKTLFISALTDWLCNPWAPTDWIDRWIHGGRARPREFKPAKRVFQSALTKLTNQTLCTDMKAGPTKEHFSLQKQFTNIRNTIYDGSSTNEEKTAGTKQHLIFSWSMVC
jgi:hypothetical protein